MESFHPDRAKEPAAGSLLSGRGAVRVPAFADSHPDMTHAGEQVEFGYPFVATTLPELEQMLDRLRDSPALRQAASRIMLDMAKYLSVSSRHRNDRVHSFVPRFVCSFIIESSSNHQLCTFETRYLLER